ncbi:MAG TPA: hypothetical protein H9981_07350 [Candidatus Mediterraneibacter caccavium]|uniref:Uncharacterized protein n=1 Tax=Candidatus Mediterraneibacter caccavium TaxID=2838661 RepID=A0A9D1VY18_9FIRM|nr:hypothetical protein [Candidatus Mediterraneibacter caccavium]
MELATGRQGKPHITSQQDRQKHQGIFGDGAYILNTGNMLAPEVQSSNKIHIKDGALMFQGALFTVKVGTYDEVTINNGNQGMKRKDLIVARYTYDSSDNIEAGEWAVIQGTPAADNPVVPEAESGDIQMGDSVVECPVFVVNLDGINVTGVDIIPETMADMSELIETIYDRSAMPIADFYDVTDFDLRKRGNEVFFNVSLSMQSGTQFDPNTLYSIGSSPMLSELRPQKVYFLSGYGCDSNWGNPTPISTFVDTSGYVRYCASTRKTYFKISGHWIAE